MNTIAVLARRVPDPTRLSVEKRTGRLIVEDIPYILNPVDLQALELAFRLRERHRFRVVVLSVDHTGADEQLREALALGADEAILLSDPEFEQSDPGAQAHIFQAGLEKFVKPKIILAASRSIDHTWSSIGPQLAYLLGWGLVIEAETLDVEGATLKAIAHTGARRAQVETEMPAVVTVARGAVAPRHPTAWGVSDAHQGHRLSLRGLQDLQLGPGAEAALHGRTHVRRVSQNPADRQRRLVEGPPDEVARVVARRLVDQGWAGRRP